MPSRSEITNFGAGPATLPTKVLEQAAKDLLNYGDSGMGIGELSHRSTTCANLLTKARTDLRNLLEIPETHSIIFMQGGGTTQFSATVYNLVSYWVGKEGKQATQRVGDYLVTGSWSAKAAHEASRLGVPVNMVCDSRKNSPDGKFGSIPDPSTFKYTASSKAAYVWYCDNETIEGVEFPFIPQVSSDIPLICDMSSNFASRKVDVSKYAIIYAGAQKNVGLAGITIVIVRNDIMEARATDEGCREADAIVTPIMMDYKTIATNDSLYNTLPIFTTHVVGLVFAHLLDTGGIAALERVNAQKAKSLYAVLESIRGIRIIPDTACRSRMNVCFKFVSEDGPAKEQAFLKAAEERGMMQLKGHRSVGGLRASLYNAISLEDVQKLTFFITEFFGR